LQGIDSVKLSGFYVIILPSVRPSFPVVGIAKQKFAYRSSFYCLGLCPFRPSNFFFAPN